MKYYVLLLSFMIVACDQTAQNFVSSVEDPNRSSSSTSIFGNGPMAAKISAGHLLGFTTNGAVNIHVSPTDHFYSATNGSARLTMSRTRVSSH